METGQVTFKCTDCGNDFDSVLFSDGEENRCQTCYVKWINRTEEEIEARSFYRWDEDGGEWILETPPAPEEDPA